MISCLQVELEFLTPHIPTVEEKADPKLFASNVRKEMATALGIQLCDLRWPISSLLQGVSFDWSSPKKF